MSRQRKIKVKYSKLGKSKVWGLAYLHTNTIVIDERAKGKKHLELLIHEVQHIQNHEMNEDDVVRSSIEITNVLWQQGYRRVDLSNKQKLQDGSK